MYVCECMYHMPLFVLQGCEWGRGKRNRMRKRKKEDMKKVGGDRAIICIQYAERELRASNKTKQNTHPSMGFVMS